MSVRSRSAKRADLVIWSPAFFGAKPDAVLLGGTIVAAPMGRSQRLDPDAAARALPPDVRRLRQEPYSEPGAVRVSGFDRQGAWRRSGVSAGRCWRSRARAKIGKKDMVHNSLCPKIEVDPETYEVRRPTASF